MKNKFIYVMFGSQNLRENVREKIKKRQNGKERKNKEY